MPLLWMRRLRAFVVRRVRWASKWLDRFCSRKGERLVRRSINSSHKYHGSSEQRCGGGRLRAKMKKSGKNIEKARKAIEVRPYTLQEAVPLLQKVKFAKFDETVEVTLRLGVDPKHADQMVRGTVVLPHGLGTSKKALVMRSGEKRS